MSVYSGISVVFTWHTQISEKVNSYISRNATGSTGPYCLTKFHRVISLVRHVFLRLSSPAKHVFYDKTKA